MVKVLEKTKNSVLLKVSKDEYTFINNVLEFAE
jgi:DNA-directed RNA polymerase subunit L